MEQPSKYLSPAEVAKALGVGVSTVKRWVDGAILPAHRTAGGHRKLLLADVLRMVRENEFPHLDLGKLEGTPTAPHPQHLRDALTKALEAGDESRVRTLVVRAFEGGMSVAALADDALAPALRAVGHLWESGRLDVYEEHRGTQICIAALSALRTKLEASVERGTKPLALGAGPEGDHYLLPGMLAQLVLAESGWKSIFLGPNMPLASLALAAETQKPRMVFLSATYLADRDAFRDDYLDFYRRCRNLNIAVALGGQAIDAELRAHLPWSFCGDTLTQLAEFARTLEPRPTRPRRGRPKAEEK